MFHTWDVLVGCLDDPDLFRLSYDAALSRSACPTLSDHMNCSLPGSSVHGDSPGKNTAVGCHALLQGIFPIQGLNPGLPHCRQILYQLSHKGSPSLEGRLFIHMERKKQSNCKANIYVTKSQGKK